MKRGIETMRCLDDVQASLRQWSLESSICSLKAQSCSLLYCYAYIYFSCLNFFVFYFLVLTKTCNFRSFLLGDSKICNSHDRIEDSRTVSIGSPGLPNEAYFVVKDTYTIKNFHRGSPFMMFLDQVEGPEFDHSHNVIVKNYGKIVKQRFFKFHHVTSLSNQ